MVWHNFLRARPNREAEFSPSRVHATIAFRNFLENLVRRPKPCVLDLGYVCGRNVEYLCNLGMKVYVQDILGALARNEPEE